jgi:hypothetical protein
LGKLLKLGSQIYPGRLLDWRCVLFWGLLGLGIGYALLVSLLILLLCSRILLSIFLILVVSYSACSANNDRRAYHSSAYTSDRSSYHCSST